MNFDGIWTPIVTPFAANGRMDLGALAPLVDRLVGQKISGLIVGGTTGEYYALSNQERKDLLKHVAGLARGRIPLMAWKLGRLLSASMYSKLISVPVRAGKL
jgi:4-hydroxy-tetrahydrodipicolinate synthase